MFSSEVSLLSQVRRKHSASFFGNVFQMSGERTFCAAVLKQIGYSSAVRRKRTQNGISSEGPGFPAIPPPLWGGTWEYESS